MADSLTQQTVTRPGVYAAYVGNVQDQTVDKQFGVSTGTPATVSLSGDTTVYTPASGKHIRLKWIGLSSPSTNTATTLVTVKIGATTIYLWDMGAPGGFAHRTVREGAANETLVVNLSDAQTVRVNFDLEEF